VELCRSTMMDGILYNPQRHVCTYFITGEDRKVRVQIMGMIHNFEGDDDIDFRGGVEAVEGSYVGASLAARLATAQLTLSFWNAAF